MTKALMNHDDAAAREVLHDQGMFLEDTKPLATAIATLVAFVIIGFIPILPLLFIPEASFFSVLVLVAIVLFILGSLRSRITAVSWFRGGMEIMSAGVIASLIAFYIGEVLSQLLLT